MFRRAKGAVSEKWVFAVVVVGGDSGVLAAGQRRRCRNWVLPLLHVDKIILLGELIGVTMTTEFAW